MQKLIHNIEENLLVATLVEVISKNIDSENFLDYAKALNVKDLTSFLSELISHFGFT